MKAVYLLTFLSLNFFNAFNQSFNIIKVGPESFYDKEVNEFQNHVSTNDSSFYCLIRYRSGDGDYLEDHLINYDYSGDKISSKRISTVGINIGDPNTYSEFNFIGNTLLYSINKPDYVEIGTSNLNIPSPILQKSRIAKISKGAESSIFISGNYYDSLLRVKTISGKDSILWENSCRGTECFEDYKPVSSYPRVYENYSALIIELDQSTGSILNSHVFTGRKISLTNMESNLAGDKVFFTGSFQDSLLYQGQKLFQTNSSGERNSFFGMLENDTIQWINQVSLHEDFKLLVDNTQNELVFYESFDSSFSVAGENVVPTDNSNIFEWTVSFEGDFIALSQLPVVGSNPIYKIRDNERYMAIEFLNITVGDSIVYSNIEGQRDIALIQLNGSDIIAYSHTGSTKADVLKGFDLDEMGNLNVFVKYSWDGITSSSDHAKGIKANVFSSQVVPIVPPVIEWWACIYDESCYNRIAVRISDKSITNNTYKLEFSPFEDFSDITFSMSDWRLDCYDRDKVVFYLETSRYKLVDGLPYDSTLYMRAVNVSPGGSSLISNTKTFQTSLFPEEFGITQISTNQATIQWKVDRGGCFPPDYKLERSEGNSPFEVINQQETNPYPWEESSSGGPFANTLEYVDHDLKPNNTYKYRLRPYFYDWESDLTTKELSITTLDTLFSPSGLAVHFANNSVSIIWSDNSPNESGFVLERAYDSLISQAYKTFELDADQTSYVDKEITDGQTYYYRIKGINENTESDWSNVVMVEVPVILSSSLDQSNFTIYPNPSDDYVIVELPKQISSASLSVYELTGNLLLERMISGKHKVENLSQGLYFFVLENNAIELRYKVVIR